MTRDEQRRLLLLEAELLRLKLRASALPNPQPSALQNLASTINALPINWSVVAMRALTRPRRLRSKLIALLIVALFFGLKHHADDTF